MASTRTANAVHFEQFWSLVENKNQKSIGRRAAGYASRSADASASPECRGSRSVPVYRASAAEQPDTQDGFAARDPRHYKF